MLEEGRDRPAPSTTDEGTTLLQSKKKQEADRSKCFFLGGLLCLLVTVLIVVLVVVFSTGGSSSSSPSPPAARDYFVSMELPTSISVVEPSSTTTSAQSTHTHAAKASHAFTHALIPARVHSTSAPTAGAYATDAKESYVVDDTTDIMRTPSTIMCYMRAFGITKMVNQGLVGALGSNQHTHTHASDSPRRFP